MMAGVDMNRVHLWMGLAHPIYGPVNLAYYMAVMGPHMYYAAYVKWIEFMIDTVFMPPKPRNPS
ncbi:MAG: hypothetical protein AB7S70_04040 [Hyphomicrobium sp.]|uniref:hypothetical protein n=1 Tax=Hyphomicrobium sp. TaxID=82 RepID=UPI003D1381A8